MIYCVNVKLQHHDELTSKYLRDLCNTHARAVQIIVSFPCQAK